MLYKILLLQSN